MDSEQFAKYLELLDHPKQLTLGPNVSSLYYLYREHMTTFTYNNLRLYLGKPKCDLSISGLLKDVPSQGGHCYQHSELMFAALSYLGFQVERENPHITSSLFNPPPLHYHFEYPLKLKNCMIFYDSGNFLKFL